MKLYKLFFAIGFLFLCSCASRKNIDYLQDIDRLKSETSYSNYETILSPNDVLSVVFSSSNPEVVAPFNGYSQSSNNAQNQGGINYLVDVDGFIELPVIGKVKAGGLTKNQLQDKIKNNAKRYVKDVVVNVRVLNYKITVLGEVTNPGSYSIPDERVTLLEALGLAGDLTIYGLRNEILIVREENGIKNYKKVDITKTDFFDSEFYFLRQNDVVIVPQNYYEVQRAASNPNNRLYISLASLTISIIVLLTR